MPEATMEGPISEAVESFRAVVAASPRFRTFVGASSQEEALDKLFLYTDDGEGSGALGVVDIGDEFEELDLGIEVSEYRGTLILWLEDEAGDTEGRSDATRRFNNDVGVICREVRSLRFTDASVGGPCLTGWRFLQRPTRMNDRGDEVDKDSGSVRDEYYLAIVEFRFGGGA